MPVFEGLLQWVNSFRGLSLTEMLDKLTFDFKNLGTNFSNWAKSIDWAQVSADLIAGIQSIDWAMLGANVGSGFRGILDGLGTIIQGIDWGGLFSAISVAFLDFLAGLTGQGNWDNVKATWSANWNLLKQTASTAMNAMKASFQNTLNNIKSAFMNVFNAIKAIITNAISGAVNAALGVLDTLLSAINNLPTIPTGSDSESTPSTPTERASGGYGSGMTLVGEHGPELVNLPSGAYVNNSLSSRSAANQPVQAFIDYDELARVMGRVMGQQMQRRTG